jgi:hypothetical protein
VFFLAEIENYKIPDDIEKILFLEDARDEDFLHRRMAA